MCRQNKSKAHSPPSASPLSRSVRGRKGKIVTIVTAQQVDQSKHKAGLLALDSHFLAQAIVEDHLDHSSTCATGRRALTPGSCKADGPVLLSLDVFGTVVGRTVQHLLAESSEAVRSYSPRGLITDRRREGCWSMGTLDTGECQGLSLRHAH